MDITQELPVLVYGTLRPTGGNYENLLEGCTVAETTVQLDGFTMYGDSGCPFLDFGDRTIVATLLQIDSDVYTETMENLDALEGFRAPGDFRNSYERVAYTFTLNGVDMEAWVYVMSDSLRGYIINSTPILESGDWIQHVAQQNRMYAR